MFVNSVTEKKKNSGCGRLSSFRNFCCSKTLLWEAWFLSYLSWIATTFVHTVRLQIVLMSVGWIALLPISVLVQNWSHLFSALNNRSMKTCRLQNSRSATYVVLWWCKHQACEMHVRWQQTSLWRDSLRKMHSWHGKWERRRNMEQGRDRHKKHPPSGSVGVCAETSHVKCIPGANNGEKAETPQIRKREREKERTPQRSPSSSSVPPRLGKKLKSETRQ